jgi:hypothetical protein
MTIAEELFRIAGRLDSQSNKLKNEEFNKPLQRLADAAERVGRAWSGSWLGYHSRVYYADLAEPPPGARFSQEWGMMDTFAIRDTVGDWREYRFDDVVSAIQQYAGNPDTQKQEASLLLLERFSRSHNFKCYLLFPGFLRFGKMTSSYAIFLRK